MPRRLPIALALSCGAACATYSAVPLEPERMRAEFEARTLDDPGLLEFARPRTSATFPPSRWDLERLTLVAFYAHPDLAPARSRVAAARAAAITAGQRPNPTLSFDPEYVTNAASGVEPWVFGFRLDFPLETGEKRELRIEGAQREVELAELDVDATAWRVRSELRAAFVEHALTRTELDVVRNVRELQREVLDALRNRFDAGEVSRPDVATGEVDLARAELDVASVESRLSTSRARLALAVGVAEQVLAEAQLGDAELDLPVPDAPRARDLALLGGLELRRARIEYELAETRLHAAVAAQYPDVHLAPGYTWDQGDHKFAFGAAFELPLFHSNQGAIAEASAARDVARDRFAAVQARVIGEVDRALAQQRGAAAELAFADQLVERSRGRVSEEQRAFDVGASDRLGLAQARLQNALLERARIDALRRVGDAQGALEDVLQRPLKDLEEHRP